MFQKQTGNKGNRMVARTRELNPLRSARDLYGKELRRHRENAGMSLDRLSEVVNYSKTHLHGVETAERLPLPPLSSKIDAAFGTGGLFEGLWEIIRREQFPDRYRRYMELEAQASLIQVYCSQLVLGLVQTADYAHAVLRSGSPRDVAEKIDEKLAARLDRQDILKRPVPPHLWLILDEAALRRPVDGPEVMRAQLDHVLAVAQRPNIVVQVLPFASGAHPAMGGSLTILTLASGTEAAYMEGSHTGHLEEDAEAVRGFRLSYDLIKALALPPDESTAVIKTAMEDYARCASPT
ncbi:helix-turn-helix domain-containing protein [Kitasatospora sp. HPMI-4]|uniref:helix-turn-helix domain-containing protein n=1 Tax=Kitasatospora sp. HPMI-4 TaxID=3448443 RepID=UPI003F19E680